MLARLREQHGDVGAADEDAALDAATDDASAAAEVRVGNARMVLDGMLEGFAAATAANAPGADDPRQNDGRSNR
jgi:hypothetical protein